ncbi:hypothetical protein SAMN05216391_10819 [Lachnospiraceae bacterium KHCPX20]|nr:hypothetical protein SAMN05216391_10819 [Lachnospiraceae bacterium KHCPX20]
MVSNLQLGDVYYTEDDYGEATRYIFIARQGQFIIGTSEYRHCHGIVDQLHTMCEETLEDEGVDMYVHYANKCYATYEEAKKRIEESEEA